MTPPGPNGTANGNSALLSILRILDLLAQTATRNGETIAKVDGKTDAILTAVLAHRAVREGPTVTERIGGATMTLLGHWGTISAMGVAAYKWLWPHMRALLGF